ncbi:hypothetical protein OROHE_014275 [Orobanche hederae]
MSGKQIIEKSELSSNFPRGVKRSNEVAYLSATPHDMSLIDSSTKVKETLKLFRDFYNELLGKGEPKRVGKCTQRFDMEVSNRLKEKGKWIYPATCFGHIPGVNIGDKFHFRAELVVVGLHRQYISGIDYTVLNGKKIATSVVNSGRYENEAKTSDVLIYSGQGGTKADQELKLGNLALVNSKEAENPVRVIQKINSANGFFAYVYDGLYVVKRFWQERDFDRKLVFKFELHRMLDQEKMFHGNGEGSRKSRPKECCVVCDVSQGKEKTTIRAMNGVDSEKPGKFCYITETMYPQWCKKTEGAGCDCINGCSNSGQCVCVLKNGGEIAYSEKGGLIGQKDVVYECGPSCKCPPSCPNRVSQRGPRYKLELYKTESRGWGVRSRSYISSGSFVCEFVGKLQQNKEVDHGPSFVISKSENHNTISAVSSLDCQLDNETETGFILDASKVGNVGRFIRHSSSPSLLVQHVLYDHDDERMPHIMFFAAKNVPPLHELTCDYDRQTIHRIEV